MSNQLRLITILAVVSIIISALAIGLVVLQSGAAKESIGGGENIKLRVYIQDFHANSGFDGGDIASSKPADPFFRISIDYNNDGLVDDYRESHTFANSDDLVLPFFATFDIPDNTTSVTIKIEVFEDEMPFEQNQKFDCSNNTQTNYILRTIVAPFEGVWEDGDPANMNCCSVRYSVALWH